MTTSASRRASRTGEHGLAQSRRLLIAGPLGAVAGVAVAQVAPWQLSALVGWDVAAGFVLAAIWWFVTGLDASATARSATREDDSRAIVDVIMVVASVVSLGGVVAGLAHAERVDDTLDTTLVAVSVLTVVISWATVNSLFMQRYARLYYTAPVGGITFSEDQTLGDDADDPRPTYVDFAYLAFTVGMTFQVSDTQIDKRTIRRTVLRQALLSYVFGTVIIGVAINVVANLVG